jgi:hypothetical protein
VIVLNLWQEQRYEREKIMFRIRFLSILLAVTGCANATHGAETASSNETTIFIQLENVYYQCESGGRLWRLGRYYAAKDFCCRFANQYPKLVRCLVQGPPSPPSPRNNSPGTQIQACAGLSEDGKALAICFANIGNTAQAVTVSLGGLFAGVPKSIQVPPKLDPETPLRPIPDLSYRAGSRQVALTLQGYCAALIEVPL